ncbi:hypothetical protein BC628DRAFT_1025569 [Trametes gibbosa]|nr:hypothetical protein BC628DRAFT_1025569 [Trametes gibbosa]
MAPATIPFRTGLRDAGSGRKCAPRKAFASRVPGPSSQGVRPGRFADARAPGPGRVCASARVGAPIDDLRVPRRPPVCTTARSRLRAQPTPVPDDVGDARRMARPLEPHCIGLAGSVSASTEASDARISRHGCVRSRGVFGSRNGSVDALGHVSCTDPHVCLRSSWLAATHRRSKCNVCRSGSQPLLLGRSEGPRRGRLRSAGEEFPKTIISIYALKIRARVRVWEAGVLRICGHPPIDRDKVPTRGTGLTRRARLLLTRRRPLNAHSIPLALPLSAPGPSQDHAPILRARLRYCGGV